MNSCLRFRALTPCPDRRRLITLNLGLSNGWFAEFRVAHGGLVLVNYRLREVPLDPETGQRRDAHVALEEAAAVLREMMQEMQIPRRPVNYALPAQSVFARFVKLPPLVQEKLDQDHLVRSAAKCPVSSGRSRLGLPARRRRAGRTDSGGPRRDQS
jgi:hypothetical protein